jgi:hypothetical protein
VLGDLPRDAWHVQGLHAKMLALARRKSMSTTSYFGSRVELTLNALPSGCRVEGHLLGLLGSFEATRVLGRGVEVLVDQLLPVSDERLSVLYALDVTVVIWTSLGPLPRWVPGPTTRWAPGTTRLALHGT